MFPLKITIFIVSLACGTNAQSASTTSTVKIPTGFFGNINRIPVQTIQNAVKDVAAMKSNALNFSMDATNQLTSGIVAAKKEMLDMGSGLASSAAQFSKSSAVKGAEILADLAAPYPVANTFASMGSKLINASATGANAVAQKAISKGNAVGTDALNNIEVGLQVGTGMIGSVGNSMIDAGKSAAIKGLDLALKGANMVDQAVDTGINTFNAAASSVNSMADNFASKSNDIAAQAQASIPGIIPSTSPGSVAVNG